MKKKQNHLWLSENVSQSTGLTEVVIDYLSDKRKTLPKKLTWLEFLLIWSLRKELFEKTSFFKHWVEPYVSMQKNATGYNRMKEVQMLVLEIPTSREFFLEKLPPHFAIGLCKTVFEYKKQFDRTVDLGDKTTILVLAVKLTATHAFSRHEILSYFEMAKDMKQFDFIAQIMINILINSFPKEGIYLLSSDIMMTTDQVAGLCARIEENPGLVNSYDLLCLYKRYPVPVITNIIAKKFDDEKNKEMAARSLFENIQNMFRVDREGEKKERNHKIYPLLRPIIPFLKLDGNGFTDLMNWIPEYRNLSSIDDLLDRVINHYNERDYGLPFDSLKTYYNYCPQRKGSLVQLYLKNIIYGSSGFKESIEAYELTKDIRIIETVIEHQMSELTSVSKDFVTFFDWLVENHSELYNKVYQQIYEYDYLEKWWSKMQNYQNYDRLLFIKFCTRFS